MRKSCLGSRQPARKRKGAKLQGLIGGMDRTSAIRADGRFAPDASQLPNKEGGRVGMDSAFSERTSGNSGAHQAEDRKGRLWPAAANSYKAAAGKAAGQQAAQPGNGEQGKKPVPMPPALMVGAKLDVRV